MSKWFICQEEEVSGPFSTDEVKTNVANGDFKGDWMIWGKPQVEWRSVDWWMREIPSILESQPQAKSEQLWHYSVDGSSFGPLKRVNLVEELKNINSIDDVLVWTKGMKSWVGIFEFHDILDEMGVNRRQIPRASLEGQVIITLDDQTHIASLRSISSGGLGADNLNGQFSIGQIVHVEIRSDIFSEPINANATVQYSTDSGFMGFKFQQIHTEAKAKIIEYVKSQGDRIAA